MLKSLPVALLLTLFSMFEFDDCNKGSVTYEITSLGISGEIPIERIVLDNVSLCEALVSP